MLKFVVKQHFSYLQIQIFLKMQRIESERNVPAPIQLLSPLISSSSGAACSNCASIATRAPQAEFVRERSSLLGRGAIRGNAVLNGGFHRFCSKTERALCARALCSSSGPQRDRGRGGIGIPRRRHRERGKRQQSGRVTCLPLLLNSVARWS